MSIIKNRQKLALTTERQTILEIIEAGLQAIQPARVMTENFKLENQQLRVVDKQFDLSKYQRIFLIGFGKGSAVQAELMADRLGNFLTEGWVIDVDGSNRRPNEKIHFTTGTHPLPSQQNFDFSKSVVEKLNQLTGSDLALVIVGGGGSALLTYPTVELEQKIALTQKLLRSGASITEMNTLRKHLSLVKGGGLAKVLYPATVVGLIFSDVPGNDLSVVASGPTVKDETTAAAAFAILQKYNFNTHLDLIETPKEDQYFEKVFNLVILNNLTALDAMAKKAAQLGLQAEIYSDQLQGEVSQVASLLLSKAAEKKVWLAGGETTVKVNGQGEGGRNQELCLWILKNFLAQPVKMKNIVFASIASDGWDNTPAAGALVDALTLKKTAELELNPDHYIANNDSYNFFQKIGDAITTDRLASNVSDLMILCRF